MIIVINFSLQLSTFGRCEYEKTCQLLISLFDQAAQRYQELVQNTSASTTDLTIQEGTVVPSHRKFCNIFITDVLEPAHRVIFQEQFCNKILPLSNLTMSPRHCLNFLLLEPVVSRNFLLKHCISCVLLNNIFPTVHSVSIILNIFAIVL